ncbi:hypothetical protein CEXT_309091 [Caerostris extrusa]|uniref:Uncharacterized protein n=1 Tax=Caerostris extrusa TaxID=172846 RepID=A0AAV4Q610_CAEEX|nr:hypothetical protein CEXT_309091 [Caerostris extrusa]
MIIDSVNSPEYIKHLEHKVINRTSVCMFMAIIPSSEVTSRLGNSTGPQPANSGKLTEVTSLLRGRLARMPRTRAKCPRSCDVGPAAVVQHPKCHSGDQARPVLPRQAQSVHY